MKLLHIDASARVERSITRALSESFVKTWLAERPRDAVVRRDVGLHPPTFVSQEWIAACFAAENERTAEQHAILALSDALIAELESADVIVLGTPMYNYGMPASLKAWFDQVVRIGKTFSFDLDRGDFPLEPILDGKMLVTLTSKGEFGFQPGGVREHMNHLDGHIESIAHYLGVTESHSIHVEYQEFRDDRHRMSREKAESDAVDLAKRLAANRKRLLRNPEDFR